MDIALAEGEEAILWAQSADATTHNLEGRLNGLQTAVAGLKKDKAALQQHVRSLVMAPTSCGGAAESGSNDSSTQSLSSQQDGDSPSPRQNQPEKQRSLWRGCWQSPLITDRQQLPQQLLQQALL